jgi:hypothetical protein
VHFFGVFLKITPATESEFCPRIFTALCKTLNEILYSWDRASLDIEVVYDQQDATDSQNLFLEMLEMHIQFRAPDDGQ